MAASGSHKWLCIFFENGSNISGAVQYADHVDSVLGGSIKEKPFLEARNCQTAHVMQFRIAKRTRHSYFRHAGKGLGQILDGFFKTNRNSLTRFYEHVGSYVSNISPSERAKTNLLHGSLVRSYSQLRPRGIPSVWQDTRILEK